MAFELSQPPFTRRDKKIVSTGTYKANRQAISCACVVSSDKCKRVTMQLRFAQSWRIDKINCFEHVKPEGTALTESRTKNPRAQSNLRSSGAPQSPPTTESRDLQYTHVHVERQGKHSVKGSRSGPLQMASEMSYLLKHRLIVELLANIQSRALEKKKRTQMRDDRMKFLVENVK